MRFPLGEMTVGDILDRGIKLLFARLPAFYLINLIVLSPVILLQLAFPFVVDTTHGGRPVNPLDPEVMFGNRAEGLLALLLTLLLQPIATAAMLHVVMEEYKGNRVGIGEAFAYAFSRFLPLLGASIVVGLMVGFGCLLCCLPGVYLGVIFAFTSQVVVLERLGVGDALSRSPALVSGYWWRVFGVLLIIIVINVIVQIAVGIPLGLLLPPEEIIPAENGIVMKFNPLNHVIVVLVSYFVGIIIQSYMAVAVILLYLDIRIRKEGYDLELAALRGEDDDDYDRPRRRRDDDDDYDDEDDRPRRRRRDDDYDDDYDDDRGRR